MTQSAVSQKNDQPCTGAGEHALSDIHAAMMEELGIGRKDTLPLQDTRQPFPDHAKIQFTLNPKEIAPGVNTWRNAVFDDVDPAEEKIDSIADGQLARIRRRMLKSGYPEPLLGRNRNSNIDKGFSGDVRNDRDSSLSRERDVGQDQTSLPKFPTYPVNPLQPQTNASRLHRSKVDKNRLNASIARLRSSIPPATTNKPESSVKSSTESTVSQSKSPKVKGLSGKGKTKSQRLKPHPARPVLQKSAWGALDENAFLAYAIKPASPKSTSDQNANQIQVSLSPSSNTLKSINKESSTLTPKNPPKNYLVQEDSKPKYTTLSASNTLNRSAVQEINQEVLTPLIHNMSILSSGKCSTNLPLQPNQKNSDDPSVSSAQINANLVETEPQKAAENSYMSNDNLWVNMEGRAMVQMDAGLGLPGYARLRGEPGSLFLELQQSDRLVARESLSNDVVLITDTMNPKFNLVFEALKEQTQPNPVWRISFEFSHIKNEFVRVILNFRAERQEKNLLQSSSTDSMRNALDILDHKTYPFFTNLIHIGTPKFQEKNKLNNAQIRTETLNDLSEIGGLSHVSTS
ncbi:putative bgh specific protein [Erysiphe neolycopersici]|uniref:Putative bgh specific protein n=1 Tax=Erysiphe neolycopersici TaxID=212602 RepID=A0A420HX96_9PEZI|nr:putative bgh specific protein [Erysiphe neolycopersici]